MIIPYGMRRREEKQHEGVDEETFRSPWERRFTYWESDDLGAALWDHICRRPGHTLTHLVSFGIRWCWRALRQWRHESRHRKSESEWRRK